MGKEIRADYGRRAKATAVGCVFILLPVLIAPSPSTASTPPQETASEESISPIQRKAEAFVLAQIPDFIQVESISWTGARIPSEIGEDVQIRISPAARFTWFGPQRLLVEYPAASGRVRKQWLTFEVRGQAKVACASQGLARGKVLGEDNVKLVSVPLAEIPADYVTELTSLVGRKVRRHFREGEILASGSLEQIADVRRGEKVGVVLNQARFTVETIGVAQEDGRVGEVIFVKNPESGKTFLGRIVSDHRVEVAL